MNDIDIFRLSLDIGREIIICGGEISRANDTIVRINNAYGNKCEVFALPSLIIAQCAGCVEIRRIDAEDTDLAELARINSLSRRLCTEANEEIHATKKTIYTRLQNTAAICAATAAFCLFFGGSAPDTVLSAAIGVFISNMGIRRYDFPVFTSNLIMSFSAALAAYVPYKAGLGIHPDKIIIGTIMLLVPGLTIVNSIRDMMKGDLIAGLFELFAEIMSALAIALGVAGGIAVMNWI